MNIQSAGRRIAAILMTSLLLAKCTTALGQEHNGMSGGFWQTTASVLGDGRDAAPASAQNPPQGFRNDYAIEVPKTGWYELILHGAIPGFRHDVFVDGVAQWRFAVTDQASKAGNLWLIAGHHTLRIQRLGRIGFPKQIFDHFELRPANGRPEASIQAHKTEVDVVRAGESLQIKITSGGTGTQAVYQLFQTNLLQKKAVPEQVTTVTFAASDTPTTQTVAIPCPAEGAFRLTAKTDGHDLTDAEFQIGNYAVVDVHHPSVGNGQTETVFDIDCVAQTINGKALDPSTFVECNGPTRITTSSAGRYRESHDCSPPEAPVPPTAVAEPVSFSGFSYRVTLPAIQTPYLIEVEYPDDTRRSVTISLNGLDPKTGELVRGSSYDAKSYETGGMFPTSGKMMRHTAILWPKSESLLIGILSQSPGHRAAAARIRILRFKDGLLPSAHASTPGGRMFLHWYEEASSWKALVNVTTVPNGIASDFVGLDRWAQLARYNGANAISALGIGYQDAFFRATTLDGVMTTDYDACRLLALICEKYHMKYVPEVYFAQWYLENVDFKEQAGNDDDWRAFSAHGAKTGTAAAPCTENPLNPVVQKQWISALGELADKLRDSPAFAGITVRCDEWGFRGEYTFPSLYWGYGDWTIRQFEHETGLKVPGGPDDEASIGQPTSDRYLHRFAFLTSSPIKAKWMAWRVARLLDYHTRILNRIRGSRQDIFFGIAGGFDADPVYAHEATYRERALGAGVDVDARQKIDGLVLMPVAHYGTRTTSIADRATYDGFFDPELVSGGMGKPRAFSAYMTYQELATYWPAAKLGIKIPKGTKPFYYCSDVIAAGRNSLEKFAVVLAEQDSAVLRDGGNTDIYGDPAIWGPWLAEYTAIPATAFEPLASATDPVAVWHRRLSPQEAKSLGVEPGVYFYVVNREQCPATLDLSLNGAETLTHLGTGETVSCKNGRLTLDLAPYELRAYRAADTCILISTTTHISPENENALRQRLAFAQELLGKFNGPLAGTLTPDALKLFRDHIDQAWDALRHGHLWRARVTLQDASMMRAYAKAGPQPAGQIVTKFPRLLTPTVRAGHWNLVEPVIDAASLQDDQADTTVRLVPSTNFNPDWTGSKVLATTQPTLRLKINVPAEGEYAIHLGHVARNIGVGIGDIDGRTLNAPIKTTEANTPDMTVFADIQLSAGAHTLTLHRPGGIGVYGMKLLPKLRPMPDAVWAVAGPFQSLQSPDEKLTDAVAKRSLERVYPPEADSALDRVYKNDDGKEIRWQFPNPIARGNLWDRGVNMPIRVQSPGAELSYGRTIIHSDRKRIALLYLAMEWWGRHLNGQRLSTNIDPKERETSVADFMTCYPTFFTVLELNKGDNLLLVKQQGGTLGSAFAGFITDDTGISLSAGKPQ